MRSGGSTGRLNWEDERAESQSRGSSCLQGGDTDGTGVGGQRTGKSICPHKNEINR